MAPNSSADSLQPIWAQPVPKRISWSKLCPPCPPPPNIYVWERRQARVSFFGNNILGSQKDLLKEKWDLHNRGPILCAFSLFFSWPNEKAGRVFLPWEELFSPDTDGVAEKKSGSRRIICLFSFKTGTSTGVMGVTGWREYLKLAI